LGKANPHDASRVGERKEGTMTTQAHGGLDFEVLRRAIEGRDAETLAGFYADDAEVLTVNRNSTPSSPNVLRGKEAIAEYLRDVCAREMTHRVENEVLDEGRIAFQEACEYPDGVRVLGAETLEVRDGKIVRQVNVEPGTGRSP
jgi:nuclear transport factor 2 (NTF2) superfamily protein